MCVIIFDVETGGLFARGANYKNLEEFDKARLVSICWLLVQGDSIVEQSYFVIKPTFSISPESTAIHGITNEYAHEHGIDLNIVLDKFYESLKKAHVICAHNISFDEQIMKSEFFRANKKSALSEFKSKRQICTMMKGRLFMKVRKYPKLSELYKYLYNEELTNAHNALDDTKHCYKCYIKLFPSDPSVFYFGNKQVNLTSEQQKVAFEQLDKNILVVACPGSGKTTTIITRIKYLLDQGVPEESIILTTFTRNSANDMRDKLFDIMGYKTNIIVGTIDSISKMYTDPEYANLDAVAGGEIDVSEYSKRFLAMIQKRPTFFSTFKYMFIDEIQDINEIQFNIIDMFYKNGVYIIGIGDDSQNIYEFRGSDIKYILNFQKHFKNSICHMLTNNFRSTPEICAVANASITKNTYKIDKKMVSGNGMSGEKPYVGTFNTTNEQYDFVVQKILNYLHMGVKEEAICIMSPVNKPLLEINIVCKRHNLKTFYSNSQESQVNIGNITLNTIHKSKGLEWQIVFLIGMTDQQNKNTIEFNKNDKAKQKKLIEANRRLFYVGITRAKKNLYILDSSGDITRFVSEINSELLG
jgi:DNA polymerase III epsilon subunit-like protein